MIDDLRTAEYVTRTLGGVRGALRQFLAEPSTRLYAVLFCSMSCKYVGVAEGNLFFFGGGERGEGKALLQSLVLRLV